MRLQLAVASVDLAYRRSRLPAAAALNKRGGTADQSSERTSEGVKAQAVRRDDAIAMRDGDLASYHHHAASGAWMSVGRHGEPEA